MKAIVICAGCQFSDSNAKLTHGSLEPAGGSKTGQGEGAQPA